MTYRCQHVGAQLHADLFYDSAAERYDYQGLWKKTAPAPVEYRSVVRDYRHNSDASVAEYVLSPSYDFSGPVAVTDPNGSHSATVAAAAAPLGERVYLHQWWAYPQCLPANRYLPGEDSRLRRAARDRMANRLGGVWRRWRRLGDVWRRWR